MKKGIYSKEQEYLIARLKEARKEVGFDQKEAAKIIGTTQSYISKVESGQRRIDVIQLKEFARIYKKPINFFID